jgi:hypothetical protein
MRWICSTHGDRKLHTNFIGKPGGKRALEIRSRNCGITLKEILKETGCEDANWIRLVHDRAKRGALVCTVMNLRASYNMMNRLSDIATIIVSQ